MSNTSGTAANGARVKCAAFWGHDGKALAEFYAAALGWKVTETYGDAAAMISDGTTRYVFYTAERFEAPNWPQDELVFHLDLSFDDVEAAEDRLVSLGATKPEHQPGGKHWTVLLDPSGQPFCISANRG
ncbi:VOC family protein [Streptomyces griseocarneus]|uniref:VOC family protein n=1 Tax=Streptomyces griseocarneus TaxID=51201 RepID=UPI00167EEDE4|nr:VOC family protein [Streptomyces griseocarneus]MBZ6477768.1 VOC family protein [Streptomyces griseocarneus]GHG61178.1 glyoxalase [Streptomyces griseocarneus]